MGTCNASLATYELVSNPKQLHVGEVWVYIIVGSN
jgi:hypothetical protein